MQHEKRQPTTYSGYPKKASSSFMICAPMSLASVADEAARRISEGGV